MKKINIVSVFILIYTIYIYSQTTIITHGYNSPGNNPINGWMIEMATAIAEKANGGLIKKYQKSTGNYITIKKVGNQNNITILLFDWLSDSNDPESGHSEAGGNALFCSLIKGEQNEDFNLDKLHFISHSRGCVVNSEAVERLLVAGYKVDQVTYLDPHDWGLYITHTDFDVNPAYMKSGIEGWKGIEWVDTYWQNKFVGLKGRPVDGSYSKYIGNIGHNKTYEWYIETIKNDNIKSGYYYSAFGKGYSKRPNMSGLHRNPIFNFRKNTIINNDFKSGTGLSKEIPGWYNHGGGGNGHIDNKHLELDFLNNSKTSDRFFINNEINNLEFEIYVFREDKRIYPKADYLSVYINNNKILNKYYLNNKSNKKEKIVINISDYKNKICQIKFEIRNQHSKKYLLNSEVWIDNIKLLK